MYKNYLFDLYGTLVDIHTDERSIRLWKQLALFMRMQGASYRGSELKKTFALLKEESVLRTFQAKRADARFSSVSIDEIEMDFDSIIQSLYERKGICASSSQIATWAMLMRSLSIRYIRLFDGVLDVLTELKRQHKAIYLLSNAQRLFTEPEMRMLGIYSLFDAIFYSSDSGWKKPSPHFYNALIERHNLIPEQTVMVGNDWEADAWGAFHSGLSSIYIHTKQSPPMTGSLPKNCRRIFDIRELLD